MNDEECGGHRHPPLSHSKSHTGLDAGRCHERETPTLAETSLRPHSSQTDVRCQAVGAHPVSRRWVSWASDGMAAPWFVRRYAYGIRPTRAARAVGCRTHGRL